MPRFVAQIVTKKIRHLALVLTKQKFIKNWGTTYGGIYTAQYSKPYGPRRTVVIQLWGDGKHRACHEFRGCSDTAPTEFHTAMGMLAAITYEATRMDSKYAMPGSLATEKVVGK